MVECLTLILEKYSIIDSNIAFILFFLLYQVFLLHVCYTFCSYPTVLGYSVLFIFSVIFLFAFHFWKFLLSCLQAQRCFPLLWPVTNEPSKGYSVFFLTLVFLLHFFFLKFPSLYLHYLYVLACCLFFSTKALIIDYLLLCFLIPGRTIPTLLLYLTFKFVSSPQTVYFAF